MTTRYKRVNNDVSSFFPYNIDYGETKPKAEAVINNLFYMSVWAVLHSLMARQPVKEKLLKVIPQNLERPLYVLQSAFFLHQVLRIKFSN